MYKTIATIDGMMCTMCEAHISEVIRKAVPGAKKVSADHKKGTATFLSEEMPSEDALLKAIADTGYTCVSVDTKPYEKKGLFGLF
ncbi:MAG: heavy-metal-associated domain-containing protein [Lachnospiraceae bacterium]|nr:heavy-metal-associated domain-containing protein [Lachnospiraceae bacterium]